MNLCQTPTSTDEKPVRFQAQGLEKSYDGGGHRVEVLQGVDLDLKRGETVAIVGVSGTGKTTLLHILGTLDRPDRGSLIYDDIDILTQDETAISTFRNQSIGFVFQFHHLLPEFTALENVMMPGLIAGLAKQQIVDAAHDILARVQLTNRTGHKVGELSGGEQQRVALARAVIMKPALLLADEPTGNLDTKTGETVFHLIREMSELFSLAAVLVTHNMTLAAEMNRCLTLIDGRLQE